MKFFLIIFFTFISLIYLRGQEFSSENFSNPKFHQADSLFNLGQYYKAARIYKDITDTLNRNEAICKTAKCYSKAGDHDEALKLLSNLINKHPNNNQYMQFYAEALKEAGRFEIALMWEEKIKLNEAKLNPNLQADELKGLFVFSDSSLIQVVNLPINSERADFAPVQYKGDLLFYSTRNIKRLKKVNIAGGSEANFYKAEAYFSENPAIMDFNEMPGYGDYEGPMEFYNNYTSVIMSRFMAHEANVIKGQDKLSGLKLFDGVVDTSSNKIIDFIDMPFNIHGFSVAHPALSKDGKNLVFVSNIAESMGGTDLFISTRTEYGWSPPEHMPAPVNSIYDELFPHFYNDTLFFFASNKPGGQGGFDIYFSDISSIKPVVVNVGAPINSKSDDFGIRLDESGLSGLFVSNRPGKGEEDIYAFSLKAIQKPHLKKPVELNSDAIFDDMAVEKNDLYLNDSLSNFSDLYLFAHEFVTGTEPARKTATSSAIYNDINNTPDTPVLGLKKDEKSIYNVQEATNQNTTSSGLTYRLQIAAAVQPLSISEIKKIHSDTASVKMFTEDQYYKYYINDYENFFVARQKLQECKVKDAFLVAYKDGQKLPLMQAVEQQYKEKGKQIGICSTWGNAKLISEKVLRFEFDKPTISGSDSQDFINILIETDNYFVEIDAWADIYGSKAYNDALAYERAMEILNLMVVNGIALDKVCLKPGGETTRFSKGVKKYSVGEHAPNRRAEIRIYSIPEGPTLASEAESE